MLNAGRDNEEVRTLKEIKLSNSSGVEVLFLPMSTSSGGAVSSDVTSFLKCIASEVLQGGIILDQDPYRAFLRNTIAWRET